MRLVSPEENRRILVVDDNRAIHDDFRKILNGRMAENEVLAQVEAALFEEQAPESKAPHFQVDSAYQGEEGLARVELSVRSRQPYAMAFVDIRMPPGWDGVETTRKLWEVDPDLQVVICTAYSDYSWDEMMERIGHSDRLLILKKPFDTVEALQLVHALTEKWRLLQETKRSVNVLEKQVQERTADLTLEIAQRRHVEEQLQIQAKAMEAAANGIVITDRDGTIIWVNPSFTRLTGYTPSEAIGQSPRLLKSGEHDREFYQNLWATITSGKTWSGQLTNRRKDGSLYIEEMTITPVRGSGSEILRFIAIKTDVTEQQQALQALRASEDRYRTLFEVAAEGILVVDVEKRQFKYANPAICRMLGYTAEELTRLGVLNIHPQESLPHVVAEFEARARGEKTLAAEIPCLRKDGSVIYANIVAAPVVIDGRKCMVGFFTDITERKRTEQERTALEVQLRHAQKLEAIGQLAAGIAHEINTPTQFIGDNTRFVQDAVQAMKPVLEQCRRLLEAAKQNVVTEQMVRDVEAAVETADLDYLMTEVPKAVQQSLDGVQRVAKIVKAMKEFSHPGSDSKVAVDLNRAIESTITVARNEWKYVADVATDFDPELPPVPCLPGEFNQAILNLLINAAHAIADVVGRGENGKGKITVSTRQVDSAVEVRIGDTGTGIPEAARPRIFDPFFTTKPVGKGTGQGLAIARSVVVDKHGGSITFETQMGRGTTFVIRLPLGTEAAKVGTAARREETA